MRKVAEETYKTPCVRKLARAQLAAAVYPGTFKEHPAEMRIVDSLKIADRIFDLA